MTTDNDTAAMNGATALIETLAECGVELCIATPAPQRCIWFRRSIVCQK